MQTNLESEIATLVAKKLGVSVSRITPDAKLVEDFKADSLSLVELTMALEEKYQIEVAAEESDRLKTVSDVKKLVERMRTKASGST